MQNPDPKLSSIITEGLDGEISLIGFPHDIGSLRDKIALGSENGPDCLRRFFVKVGPIKNSEYEVNLSQIKISDYGNIYIKENRNASLEQLLEKLKSKVDSVLNKNNISFLIGGSRDCCSVSIQSFIEKKDNPLIICLQAYPALKENSQVSQNSCLRFLFESIKDNNKLNFNFFGIQEQLISQPEKEFLEINKKNFQLTTLQSIRKFDTKISTNLHYPYTQAGQLFVKLLNQAENEQKSVYISLSLESLNNQQFPGVSRSSFMGGFQAEEIAEIMFQCGKSKLVQALDFTDYNPAIEDYRSGLLLANFFYYFQMGYYFRKQ